MEGQTFAEAGGTLTVTANRDADELKNVLETEHSYGEIYLAAEHIDTLVEKILNAKARLKGGR